MNRLEMAPVEAGVSASVEDVLAEIDVPGHLEGCDTKLILRHILERLEHLEEEVAFLKSQVDPATGESLDF